MKERGLERDELEEEYFRIYQADPLDSVVNFGGKSIIYYRASSAWKIAQQKIASGTASPQDIRILRELNTGEITAAILYLYWKHTCRNLEICITPTKARPIDMQGMWG